MGRLLISLAIIVASVRCFAADRYVSLVGNGPNTNNIHGINAQTNVSAGDTVHLLGTFNWPLILTQSGSAGSPITYLFESGANFTTNAWSVFGAIQLNSGVQWIVIDGGANGFIRNTNNGTSLGLQVDSRGIGGDNSGAGSGSHIIIRSLSISNIYVSNPLVNDDSRRGSGLDIVGTDLSISNCIIMHSEACGAFTAAATEQGNYKVTDNTFLHANHSWLFGLGDTASICTNVVYARNYMDHWDTWSNSTNNDHHHDGLFFLNNSYTTNSWFSGVYVFNNHWGGFGGEAPTAGIFTDLAFVTKQMRNYFVWNNTCLVTSNGWGNGWLLVRGSNCFVFNNTAYADTDAAHGGAGISSGGEGCFVYNNLIRQGGGIGLVVQTTSEITNGATAALTDYALTNFLNTTWSDYNNISGPCNFECTVANVTGSFSVWLGGTLGPTLADWQRWFDNNRCLIGNPAATFGTCTTNYNQPLWSATHADPHSTTGEVDFVGSTLVPAITDTAAVGKGTNLTALLTARGFPYTTVDAAGQARPTEGAWTIGAYQPTEVQTNWITIWNATNAVSFDLLMRSFMASEPVENYIMISNGVYLTTGNADENETLGWRCVSGWRVIAVENPTIRLASFPASANGNGHGIFGNRYTNAGDIRIQGPMIVDQNYPGLTMDSDNVLYAAHFYGNSNSVVDLVGTNGYGDLASLHESFEFALSAAPGETATYGLIQGCRSTNSFSDYGFVAVIGPNVGGTLRSNVVFNWNGTAPFGVNENVLAIGNYANGGNKMFYMDTGGMTNSTFIYNTAVGVSNFVFHSTPRVVDTVRNVTVSSNNFQALGGAGIVFSSLSGYGRNFDLTVVGNILSKSGGGAADGIIADYVNGIYVAYNSVPSTMVSYVTNTSVRVTMRGNFDGSANFPVGLEDFPVNSITISGDVSASGVTIR